MVETLPSNAGGAGSIPGQGARIPHGLRPKGQNIKQKQYCDKFNKDFKNGPHQKNLLKKPQKQKKIIKNKMIDLNLNISIITLNINSLHTSFKKQRGFPGGAVVESLPANAGDAGSSPGLGGSHVLRSSWAREPQLLSLRVWSLCSAAGEATMERGPRTVMKSGPRLPQLERALAQKRRPNTAINK